MRSSPQILETLRNSLSANIMWNQSAPVRAFATICGELEPHLVFATEEDRLQWLVLLDELRFWSARALAHGNGAGHFSTSSLASLVELAKRAWRAPTNGPHRRLPFVRNAARRHLLERDYDSFVNSRKAMETKLAVILAGSIIEGVLWDVLDDDKPKSSKAAQAVASKEHWKRFDVNDRDRWKLHQVVRVCGPDGLRVLGARGTQAADAVREWRNFVHPNLELLEKEPLRESDAALAEALLLSVLDDVEAWRSRGAP